MLRFIIYALGIFLLLSLLFGGSTILLIIRLIFGGRRKPNNTNQQPNEKPETQNDRIITYKKKEFETSAAEDIEFEEIKDKEK